MKIDVVGRGSGVVQGGCSVLGEAFRNDCDVTET